MLKSPEAIHYGAAIAWKFHDADEWRIYYAALHGMSASKAAVNMWAGIAAKQKGWDLPGPSAWASDFAQDAVAQAMLIMAVEAS